MDIKETVLAANQRFYQALNDLDLAEMETVWLQDARARCVHPGWELLSGWQDIQRSWAAIFANSHRLQVQISDVEVALAGSVAWVTCTEHITSVLGNQVQVAVAITTNIFLRLGSEWKLAHHQASPHPGLHQPEGPSGPRISRN